MFSILEEVECYITCITDSDYLPLILFLILSALLLFASYLHAKSPYVRIASLATGQLFMISSIAAIVTAMQCSSMLTIEIYTIYVIISTALIFLLPKVYYKILIKRYNARPIADVLDWPEPFVRDILKDAKVYYYDSAVPRAFASGKIVFLSMGLLELMNDQELKTILAHEVWHLRQNTKTPLLRQLALITFTKNSSESDLEKLADMFAEEIVSKSAVETARAKLN
jgi:heat shock protein HtpX